MTPMLPFARASVRCALFGHKVHHTKIASDACTPCARCGAAILDQGNSVSRVLLGHVVTVNEIHGDWAEYVCRRCGHPFYFRLAAFGQLESGLQQGPYE